jgi:hypothetical protein
MSDYNVLKFPDKGGGGDGPEDPMLEQRVVALEARLDKLDVKVDRIEAAVLRLEPLLRDISTRLTDLSVKVASIEGRMSGLEGRFSQIPTTWQIIAIFATFLIGLTGLLFASAKFFHP